LGEHTGKSARSNLPELPNTMLTVMICWVSNGKDFVLAPQQLQALHPDVRHWEEFVDFIDTNGGLKEPYNLTPTFKCNLEQDKLEGEYMGLYTHGQIINDPIYGQISYNRCCSNTFHLKHGHSVKIFLVEMLRARGKEFAEHIIRLTKVITASHVNARCKQLVIMIHRLWKVLKMVGEREKRRERRMVGMRMRVVLM
jgi:hypothetical protein